MEREGREKEGKMREKRGREREREREREMKSSTVWCNLTLALYNSIH